MGPLEPHRISTGLYLTRVSVFVRASRRDRLWPLGPRKKFRSSRAPKAPVGTLVAQHSNGDVGFLTSPTSSSRVGVADGANGLTSSVQKGARESQDL